MSGCLEHVFLSHSSFASLSQSWLSLKAPLSSLWKPAAVGVPIRAPQRAKVNFTKGVTKVWNVDIKWSMGQLSAPFLNYYLLVRGNLKGTTNITNKFKMVWEGWVAVSPKFHQAVTPVLSTLLAIVIPGLFHLSYGWNVLLHEKRSSLLMACHGSSSVLSQGCQDTDMLSHARNHPSIHLWRMLIFIMQGA